MGQGWDSNKGGRDAWIVWLTEVMREVHRVLKPGSHGLVWALPRTSHWTATALEDAGFEIRDVITHLFGTGFPKSHDVSKAIDKMHGAEREVIGERTFVQGGGNSLELRQGPRKVVMVNDTLPATDDAKQWQGWGTALKPASEHWILIRKPLNGTVATNIVQHGTGALNIDASRIRKTDGTSGRWPANVIVSHNVDCAEACTDGCAVSLLGSPSRFYYCAKPSKREKNAGCESIEPTQSGVGALRDDGRGKLASNSHPTVKSIALMQYLIRLITPPQGSVLDMFAGSGSTLVAAQSAGFSGIGIEREADYIAIARARLGMSKSDAHLTITDGP